MSGDRYTDDQITAVLTRSFVAHRDQRMTPTEALDAAAQFVTLSHGDTAQTRRIVERVRRAARMDATFQA